MRPLHEALVERLQHTLARPAIRRGLTGRAAAHYDADSKELLMGRQGRDFAAANGRIVIIEGLIGLQKLPPGWQKSDLG